MNFLKVFQLALEGVVAVENVFAHSLPGASKLDLVLSGVQAAAKSAETSGIPQVAAVGVAIDTGEQVLVPLIAGIVQALHVAGLFHHKAAPAPAPTPINVNVAPPAAPGPAPVAAPAAPATFQPV